MNKELKTGDRVEIAPHYDLWMRGARFGTILSIKNGIAAIKMDHTQVKKLAHVFVTDLKRI